MGKKKKKKNKLTFYDEKSNNIIDDPEKNIVKYDLEFRNFDIENDVVKPNEEVDNNDEKERLEDDYSLLGSNDIDWAIYDDFNCINDDYWSNYEDGKRIKCAEVLVPSIIEYSYIIRIHCLDTQTIERICVNKHNIPIVQSPKLYFD